MLYGFVLMFECCVVINHKNRNDLWKLFMCSYGALPLVFRYSFLGRAFYSGGRIIKGVQYCKSLKNSLRK